MQAIRKSKSGQHLLSIFRPIPKEFIELNQLIFYTKGKEKFLKKNFDLTSLCTAYNLGRLVPFIGSGMSMPTCVSWKKFIEKLEGQCGIKPPESDDRDLIQRAHIARQKLLLSGDNVAEAIEKAVYSGNKKEVPKQTTALASLFWPLVCTTNYDDIYLRAKFSKAAETQRQRRVFGRSDSDCRHILHHLNFPTSEVVWALQGFLRPRDKNLLNLLGTCRDADQLAKELVVGHAEYRREAHRAPHFRRCFAEVFRTSSLFFLGSGLTEHYFLTLFDEIIELTGPPVRPHFAIIEEGMVDPDLMRQQYHIVCMTYPKDKHDYVTDYLKEFCAFVEDDRVRLSSWGFRIRSPKKVEQCDIGDNFKVVRGPLPKPTALLQHEAVAISCGRPKRSGEVPLVSPYIADAVGINEENEEDCEWLNNWTVKWTKLKNVYGIVARELMNKGDSSRDRRSPEAIRIAFLKSLKKAEEHGIKVLHVQLLGAGENKVFHPWISLIQMAKAYGQFFRERKYLNYVSLSVHLYVVDPSIIALLQGSFIDLVEHLEDSRLLIGIEVIDTSGNVTRYHQFVNADDKLAKLVGKSVRIQKHPPTVSVHPTPLLDSKPKPLPNVQGLKVKNLGLVSGSTLIIDYRKRTLKMEESGQFNEHEPPSEGFDCIKQIFDGDANTAQKDAVGSLHPSLPRYPPPQ